MTNLYYKYPKSVIGFQNEEHSPNVVNIFTILQKESRWHISGKIRGGVDTEFLSEHCAFYMFIAFKINSNIWIHNAQSKIDMVKLYISPLNNKI